MALGISSIKRNFGLKLTALLIALLLWFTFNYLGAAQSPYTKTIELPLGIHQVASGLVASVSAHTVSVELAGARTQLDALTPAGVDAFIDCTGKTAGTYSLTVNVVAPEGDKVKSVTPPHAIVVIDAYAYRKVPVVARESRGGPLPAARVEPDTITVAGAQSAVARVVAAEVTVPVHAARQALAAEVKPVPMDGSLAPIAGLASEPPIVRVTIPARRAAQPRG